ncbi:unnamed protein product [Linum trigynum]|uniref:Uncharacterized protein n=1 Tax=Linum trigynum TaxID=586398 RepID=A0AAV2F8N8_9ROSI
MLLRSRFWRIYSKRRRCLILHQTWGKQYRGNILALLEMRRARNSCACFLTPAQNPSRCCCARDLFLPAPNAADVEGFLTMSPMPHPQSNKRKPRNELCLVKMRGERNFSDIESNLWRRDFQSCVCGTDMTYEF